VVHFHLSLKWHLLYSFFLLQLYVIVLSINLTLKMVFYMVILKEYICSRTWVCCSGGAISTMVCRLHRSINGLKQSPRAWFGRFSTIVQQFGMIRSQADHSVFLSSLIPMMHLSYCLCR